MTPAKGSGVFAGPHEPDELIGRTLAGRFTIRRELGRGGMGVVYLAWQHSLEREVAIKVLRTEILTDQARRSDFDYEAYVMGQVSSPHTIELFELGEDDGLLFMAMELLRGRTLKQELAEISRLTAPRALEIARQVSAALAAAHAKRVVHRDIKPDNIFITNLQAVKLIDWGLAKVPMDIVRSRPPSRRRLPTRPGIFKGTPCYVAPEGARGERIDSRADIYSLGLVLYEMLIGERPFPPGTREMALCHHIYDEPPPLPEYVPGPVRTFVMRMLAKNPKQRPQTAEEVEADCVRLIEEATALLEEQARVVVSPPPPLATPLPRMAVPRLDRTGALEAVPCNKPAGYIHLVQTSPSLKAIQRSRKPTEISQRLWTPSAPGRPRRRVSRSALLMTVLILGALGTALSVSGYLSRNYAVALARAVHGE